MEKGGKVGFRKVRISWSEDISEHIFACPLWTEKGLS
jgi:hypothetical protein